MIRSIISTAGMLLLASVTTASAAPPIIGGEEAKAGELPWQVSIVETGKNPAEGHRCGGSLYAERWVITAGHCVDDVTKDGITVAAGRVELKRGIKLHRVKRIVIHPDYVPAVVGVTPPYDDVALLELETRVRSGRRQRPIALIDEEEERSAVVDGTLFTVSGWGLTRPDGQQVETVLRKVEVPFAPRDRCNRPEAHNGSVTDEMICAGYAAGGKDACSWDSGGPLALRRAGQPALLVGIVSWGSGCAEPDKYGVYTRVARYRTWIEETVATAP